MRKTELCARRKELNLTQAQVAKSAGIDRSSYCNIELGVRKPSVTTAKKLSQALGMDWTFFFDEEREQDAATSHSLK